jgi:hypothetical protein
VEQHLGPLFSNFKLSRNCLVVTNTLAYSVRSSSTMKKKFYKIDGRSSFLKRLNWPKISSENFLFENKGIKYGLHCREQSLPLTGNTKGGSIAVLLTSCLTRLGSAVWQLTILVFYLQNRPIQTNQTGGQWYSDTSPFSIPCPSWCTCQTMHWPAMALNLLWL